MKENYPLFVHWYRTLDWILTTSGSFPKSVRFSIASRITTLSLDIIESITEAIYSKDKVPIFDSMNLDFEKLRILFRISHDRKYIAARQYEYISKAIDEAGRMAGGWRKNIIEKNK